MSLKDLTPEGFTRLNVICLNHPLRTSSWVSVWDPPAAPARASSGSTAAELFPKPNLWLSMMRVWSIAPALRHLRVAPFISEPSAFFIISEGFDMPSAYLVSLLTVAICTRKE
eukprot:CAMPEP_0180273580 /NCGR_PEP_ID=MMETSP0988-20121125/4873_1 /TAXON_ID=697907 /ORGANISM="non described non described, Strain CCMP2293" /LENGTH=112 /DNA_ID=CAMNT_0022244765 /DNA_START=230 /DNA_END=565 /DNA_ORIENTATION=-